MFALCLGLTLLLEAPAYWLGLNRRTVKARLVVWLLANLISYPPVFYFFPELPLTRLACELAEEIWAPVCELAVAFFLLGRLSRREVGGVVAANLTSWLLGRFLVRPFL